MNSHCIRSDNGLSLIEIIKMSPLLFLIDFIVLLDRNGAELQVSGYRCYVCPDRFGCFKDLTPSFHLVDM